MPFIAIIKNMRVNDILDILFLTVITYHLIIWFKGTKAFKALVGLLVLGLIFTLAKAWGLFMTTWVFQILWQVLVILLIILFQSEIRQVLERVNPLEAFGLRKGIKETGWIPELSRSLFHLAKRNIGALVIIERLDLAQEWMAGCMSLEGEPNLEFLSMIFQKESPLHDGAVLIKNGRIVQVSCYLPLSPEEGVPKEWGTRHRAALGLSEKCDAWVLVVSEERGSVSLARAGKMGVIENQQDLNMTLQEAVSPVQDPGMTWQERLTSLLASRWWLKLGALGLISLTWLILAGQQHYEYTFKVPLQTQNLPGNLEVKTPVNPLVELTVIGLRKDASTLSEKNVSANVDLSRARAGEYRVSIDREDIKLPNERIQLVQIEPDTITLSITPESLDKDQKKAKEEKQ